MNDKVKKDSDTKDTKEKSQLVNAKKEIMSGLKGMRPGAVMQAVAKSLGSTSRKFLATYLLKIIVNAAKNGKIKTAAIKDAIKDFGDKNIEDNSGIDWENVKVDEAGMTFKCLFDGDSKKKLMSITTDFEDSMKDVKEDVEEADKKLNDDVKKAGVKLDQETIDKDGVIIANVIDDKENKDKSGKELKKEIEELIKLKEELKKAIEKQKKEAKTLKKHKTNSKKSDSKKETSKNTDEKKTKKKLSKKSEKSKKIDAIRAKLKSNIRKKINTDYKNSVDVSFIKIDKFKKMLEKHNFKNVWDESITKKYKRVAAIRVDYYDDEAGDVVGEAYKVKALTGKEKNKGLKKITDYIESVMKKVLGKKNLGKIYKYRKHWSGKNPDGNYDEIFVFAPYKSDDLKESQKLTQYQIINENIKHQTFIPLDIADKATNAYKKAWSKILDGDMSTAKKILSPDECNILQQIIDNSSKNSFEPGKINIGFFDYKNASLTPDQFETLKKQWTEIRMLKQSVSMQAQEFTRKVGNKVTKIFGIVGDKNYERALEFAENEGVIGDVEEISEKYLQSTLNAQDVAKSAGKELTNQILNGNAKLETGEKIRSAADLKADLDAAGISDSSLSDRVANIKVDMDEIKANIDNIENMDIDDIENIRENLPKVLNSGDLTNAFKALGLENNENSAIYRLFSRSSNSASINMAKNKLINELNSFIILYENDPEFATQSLVGNPENNPLKKSVLAELACALRPDAAQEFDKLGIDVDGSLEDTYDQLNSIADEARSGVSGAAKEVQGKVANSKEMEEAKEEIAKKSGISAFTAIGWARLAAKTTGIILNQGKSVVDVVGEQAIKYKEDKNIIAELKCLLTNGDDADDTKFDDTKFSVRFDTSDFKWHATCLDNRKMKFPEDKLIKAVFDSEYGKKFKRHCLSLWTSIFKPKDKMACIIPFILKNAENLDFKQDKKDEEFYATVKKVADNFSKIEREFK